MFLASLLGSCRVVHLYIQTLGHTCGLTLPISDSIIYLYGKVKFHITADTHNTKSTINFAVAWQSRQVRTLRSILKKMLIFHAGNPLLFYNSSVFMQPRKVFCAAPLWSHGVWLTQTYVAAEHVQDALTALPFVPTAVTHAPLGHLCAAVAHVVGSHDGP